MRKDMKQHEMDDSSHLHIALEAIAEQQKDKNQLKETVEKRATKLKITDYDYLSAWEEQYTSHRFYTSPGGYCMVLRVHFKGYGDNEDTSPFLGACICLKSGDNDDCLDWPFEGDVTITLLNQLENKHHLTRTVHFKTSDNIEVS